MIPVNEEKGIRLENCLTCLMANSATNSAERETALYPLPVVPLQLLHADHFGPLPETSDNYKHILVIVDVYTRFTWLFPTKSTRTREVNRLEILFYTFGKPQEIVTDRGTAFTSQDFMDFMVSRDIKHRKVAVAAPWANGMVERVNRFLKSSFTKLIDTPAEWKQRLGILQYIINNTYHSSVKTSPAKMLFGFDQRCHSDVSLARFTQELTGVDINLEKEKELVRDNSTKACDAVRNYN